MKEIEEPAIDRWQHIEQWTPELLRQIATEWEQGTEKPTLANKLGITSNELMFALSLKMLIKQSTRKAITEIMNDLLLYSENTSKKDK